MNELGANFWSSLVLCRDTRSSNTRPCKKHGLPLTARTSRNCSTRPSMSTSRSYDRRRVREHGGIASHIGVAVAGVAVVAPRGEGTGNGTGNRTGNKMITMASDLGYMRMERRGAGDDELLWHNKLGLAPRFIHVNPSRIRRAGHGAGATGFSRYVARIIDVSARGF